MSYEKDKLDSYVTSASLSTALAPYITSNSVSAAIAALDLSPYVTSNSLSAAVATNVLTVRGTASVSATMSAAAVTVAGRPVGCVLLGYQSLSNVQTIGFSGSWSDFCILECVVQHSIQATANATRPVEVYSDGGGTPFLSAPTGYTASFGSALYLEFKLIGGNGQARKSLMSFHRRENDTGGTSQYTATANTSFVNCIRCVSTATISSGFAVLYGWRAL
jgi:hypothetical protein